MEREYDIFEKVEGALLWRTSVTGHEAAIAKLKEQEEQEVLPLRLPLI